MIRLIAADMDGTFLDENKQYDRERFAALYSGLAARGVRFVAASGKQYLNLRRLFPAQQGEMGFIAENGALIMHEGRELYANALPAERLSEIAASVLEYPDIQMLLSSKRYAYVLPQHSAYREYMSSMYDNVQELRQQDINGLEDAIYKFSLLMPEDKIPLYQQQLQQRLGEGLRVISSGFGFLDVIAPGASKGRALDALCGLWGIRPEECMAFGDAENDLEMLEYVTHSFAMQNAVDAVKRVCRHQAPPNTRQGVLTVMQGLLEGTLAL